MKKYTLLLLLSMFLAACAPTEKKQAETPPAFEATWESLQQHETPDWFLDAKFGIYCHWGPYSVPAYENEWYSHWMYVNEGNPEYPQGRNFYEHHLKTYGSLDKFGYKDFIPMFKAENFDPAEWAELFLKAGAKFAGPVSEHADGFAMWDSELTEWDSKDMGPERDVMGELAKEIRKRDMKFIATYHRHWLFGWYPTWDSTTDASLAEYEGLYGPKLKKGDFKYPDRHGENEYYPVGDEKFNSEWLARLKEIIDKYDPDLVWFDNKMDVVSEETRMEFLKYYYNNAIEQKKGVVATYKFEEIAKGAAVIDVERARMSEAKPFPWLTDDSVDWKAWCNISDPDYKSVNRLLDVFIDIISKNGCLLLNITPRADGTIPEPVKERLLEMGEWLKINGEAVYGSRPWKVYGEGPTEVVEGHLSERANADNTSEDIRFTQNNGFIYAFLLDWPGEKVDIRSMGTAANLLEKEVASVSLVGGAEALSFDQTEGALIVDMPEKTGEHVFVLKIRLN